MVLQLLPLLVFLLLQALLLQALLLQALLLIRSRLIFQGSRPNSSQRQAGRAPARGSEAQGVANCRTQGMQRCFQVIQIAVLWL